MQAISIHQPWAYLLASGIKRYETRRWTTSYRGPIAIHATKKTLSNFERLFWLRDIEGYKLRYQFPENWKFELHYGCVLATGTLEEVIPAEQLHHKVSNQVDQHLGDYLPGYYAWHITNIKSLPTPVPALGSRKLWEWEE